LPLRFGWTMPSRRRRARCCETEDCRIKSTDFSPSQRRQRIKRRNSCASDLRNVLACFARLAIRSNSAQELEDFLDFLTADENLGAGRETRGENWFWVCLAPGPPVNILAAFSNVRAPTRSFPAVEFDCLRTTSRLWTAPFTLTSAEGFVQEHKLYSFYRIYPKTFARATSLRCFALF
jgi:hypothetical protein